MGFKSYLNRRRLRRLTLAVSSVALVVLALATPASAFSGGTCHVCASSCESALDVCLGNANCPFPPKLHSCDLNEDACDSNEYLATCVKGSLT